MISLLSSFNPGLFLIVIGLIVCFVPAQRVRQILTVGAPIAGLAILMMAERGVDLATAHVVNAHLVLYHVDSLNFIFGIGFLIVAFLYAIYALHRDDRLHEGGSTILLGSAIAAVFAGDMMSLFIFWEIGTVAAAFQIFRAGTKAAYQAGMRFLGFHILSGVLLLDGLIYVYKKAGSFAYSDAGFIESFSHPAAKYVFAAFAIKAAFPLVHTWLKDVTSKTTVLGSIILPIVTTVLAVYAFARIFPGLDILIWAGAIIAAYAVVFAATVNDYRRSLAYAQNALTGIAICAIGVGTPLALNAAAGLAFTSLIVMTLLFMVVGAVLYRTGTAKVDALGGLWRTMPLSAIFAIIGAVSLAGLPFFLGGVTLPIALYAIGAGASFSVTLLIMLGMAGLVYAIALRLPLNLFFGTDSARRPAEAPFNMIVSMGLASALCVLLALPALIPGLGYGWLYGLMPCSAGVSAASCGVTGTAISGFEPYTLNHMSPVLQIAFGTGLAYLLIRRFSSLGQGATGIVLDTDWIYRKWGYGVAKWSGQVWQKAGPTLSTVLGGLSGRVFSRLEEAFSPRGSLARGGLNSGAAIWSAVLLGFVMLVVLLSV